MKLDDFKALNPSAHRPVIIASGTPQILLPWDSATVFQRNFEGYTQGQYASWTAWTAPATMNPAEAARRVGMSEGDLRSVNNIPPRMLIKVGSTLLVPRTSRMAADVDVLVADTAQVSLAPEIVTHRTTVHARKGESVTSLAKRFGVPASNVASWNSVSGTALFKKGQSVVVFLPVGTHKVSAGKGHARSSRQASAGSKSSRSSKDKTVVKTKKR